MLRLLFVALAVLALAIQPANAATGESLLQATNPGSALTLEAGTGRVMTVSGSAANIFVADPKVAEVRPASASALFLFGVAPGRTTIAAMDSDGRLLAQYELTVQPSTFGAKEAQAAINRLIPNSNVKVQAQQHGFLLTGEVKSPADATQVMAIAKDYAGDSPNIDNEIVVQSPIQVTLNVRIAQVSRQVVRKLGINWQTLATIGSIAHTDALTLNINSNTFTCGTTGSNVCPGANFNGVIDALAQDNLAHVLAEPNLTVMSGEAASFQVGGEFPIPVSQQNNQVTVSYKNFGVMLSFVPTVLSDGRINLHVKPEVSELTNLNSFQLPGPTTTLVVPGLTVRRAETTVEVGSGQSFAIAGMLQQSTTDQGTGIPGLGDTPILGAMFRDSNFNRTETELVVVITPYIVRPVNRLNALHLPSDGLQPPPEIERLLLMRQVAQNKPPVPISIPGAAGFVVQ